MPEYAGNTSMVISTDHGRGSYVKDWMHHASENAVKGYLKKGLKQFPKGIEGSENVWLAAVGSKVAAKGLIVSDKEFKLVQIASTVLSLISKESKQFSEPPIDEIISTDKRL